MDDVSADWAECTDSGGDTNWLRGKECSDSELFTAGKSRRLTALCLRDAIRLVDDRKTDCGIDAVKGERVC